MPDHLVMLLEDDDAHASESPLEMTALIDARAAFVESLRGSGALHDAGRFRPGAEAKRVRRRRGDAPATRSAPIEIEEGPARSRGRSLSAYLRIQAPTLDEAATLAAGYPRLPTDEIEVRPVMKGRIDDDKESRPGKVFGFAVLGDGAVDEDWVAVMDRIDAETTGCFDPASFLGGVRLEPPSAGRRVVGERRATVDGPFLESKEVIGGLFFMRMATVDDAVRWAADSRFVVHGTLEVRELWRS